MYQKGDQILAYTGFGIRHLGHGPGSLHDITSLCTLGTFLLSLLKIFNIPLTKKAGLP